MFVREKYMPVQNRLSAHKNISCLQEKQVPLGWATLSLLFCPALLLQLKGLAMEKTKKVSASYLKVRPAENG